MMQPGRANVGAAMIAHRAEHPPLQLPKGHVVGEPADVQFGVVVTVRIAAIDEHVATPAGSHVGQPHGLIVKHQVRDRPGIPHQLLNGRVSKSSCSLGLNVRPVTCPLRVLTVSQLSRRAKENPVRGADFERGKFSGGAAHRDNSAHARAPRTNTTTGLLLIVCPEPDTEIVAVTSPIRKGLFWNKSSILGNKSSICELRCESLLQELGNPRWRDDDLTSNVFGSDARVDTLARRVGVVASRVSTR
jgi:hypothetical protein